MTKTLSSCICALVILGCSTPTSGQTEGSLVGKVHAFDMRTRNNFLTFPANDPSSLRFIDKNRLIAAMDFDGVGQRLWAIDRNSMQYGQVDVASGVFISSGDVSGDIGNDIPTGMTFSAAVERFLICTKTDLYYLDVTTGMTFLVGGFNAPGPDPDNMMEIASNEFGQLYGFEGDPFPGDGQTEGGLWSIDLLTASCTLIAPNFIEAVDTQAMDFDNFTDNLYVAIHSIDGFGSYGIWNHTNGSFFEILPLPAFGPARFKLAIANNMVHSYNVATAPHQFMTFLPDAPLPVATVAEIAVYDSHAIDFAADNLTLIIHDNLTDHWGTIDTDTGCFSPTAVRSGDLTVDPNGLSCDPTTGNFYAVASGAFGSELYAVYPETGDSVLLAFISSDGSPLNFVVDIAINNDGKFFIFDVATNLMYQLDSDTGDADEIGDPGVSANFAQGMDFDPFTGVLHQAIYSGQGLGSYGTWDLNSGIFTEILSLDSFFDPMGRGYELEIAIGSNIILGDVNGDGEVNLLDVQPFVDAISSGTYIPEADINQDGEVNLLDIGPFIVLISG